MKGNLLVMKAYRIIIVTTAAPPWQTGTAINPLLRARALSKTGHQVILYVPYLEERDQRAVYPAALRFKTREDHAHWIQENYDCRQVDIRFYSGTWSRRWRSIFPVVPPHIDTKACDLLLLEEPERLLFANAVIKFSGCQGRVVGIIHTNYGYFLQSALGNLFFTLVKPFLLFVIRRQLTRRCDRIIRLSSAVPAYSRSISLNVNGVRDEFIELPMLTQETTDVVPYFVGKLVWEKGFDELVDLLKRSHCHRMDIFGAGEDRDRIDQYAQSQGIVFSMKGPTLSPTNDLAPYRVFINTSRSEVLCTTTAEALAMGKWAIVPRHPSNEYFYDFATCLPYSSPEEFAMHLRKALHDEPPVIHRDVFCWERATERLLEAVFAA